MPLKKKSKLEPIEKTGHSGGLPATREAYLIALIDELLCVLGSHADFQKPLLDPDPPRPGGGYVVGKTYTPWHPVEQALRALAWQWHNDRPNLRLTVAIAEALRHRKLIPSNYLDKSYAPKEIT